MFEDVILETLALGPKTTADFYRAAQAKRPEACTPEPCRHRDPQIECDFEWQHQLRLDEERLARAGRITRSDGLWNMAQAGNAPVGKVCMEPGVRQPLKQAEPDLATTYLGLQLRNPLIVSACPLTGEIDVLHRLEELGAAAAVLPSLFEEQIEHAEPTRAAMAEPPRWSASLQYYRELAAYNRGPEAYLHHLTQAKRELSIPIIGSLNVTGLDGWLEYARRIEQAGADALELNMYFVVTDPTASSADVEQHYVDLVAAVHRRVSIPLAVKLSPYFTALPQFARQIVAAGAKGLVLFNRYLQPDLDIENLEVVPDLYLSTSHELRLPLRWIAILRGQLACSLAATGGVHSSADVIKAILVGADAVQMSSALYHNGLERLGQLLTELPTWLARNGFPSVQRMRGVLSQQRCPDPTAFERANYTKAISSFLNGR